MISEHIVRAVCLTLYDVLEKNTQI